MTQDFFYENAMRLVALDKRKGFVKDKVSLSMPEHRSVRSSACSLQAVSYERPDAAWQYMQCRDLSTSRPSIPFQEILSPRASLKVTAANNIDPLS
jgi:hypothetical protein